MYDTHINYDTQINSPFRRVLYIPKIPHYYIQISTKSKIQNTLVQAFLICTTKCNLNLYIQ